MNRTEIIGNVGQDPELRYTASEKAVCNLSVATSNNFLRDGKWTDTPPTWHSVTVWGDLAQKCAALQKGDRVYVCGRIKYQEWEDKDGFAKKKTIIDAQQVLKVVKWDREESESSSSAPGQNQSSAGPNNNTSFESDDDLPF